MSCYGCAKSFSLFCKEHGCPSCGFSYCNKCLKYQCAVPKLGNALHKVCKSCSIQMTTLADREPPAAFIKRLESLEDPSRPPITVYKRDSRMERLKTGLEDPDRQIAERLERLREDRKRSSGLTDEEIARRLAALRGEDPEKVAARNKLSVLAESDNRTDAEKAESLIKQFMEEQQIASKYLSPVEEISRRLARLRDQREPESCQVGESEATAAAVTAESESSASGLESITVGEVAALLKQMEHEESGASKAAKECLKKIHNNILTKRSKKKEEENSESDNEDEEECVQKIVEKVMKEAEIDKRLGEFSDESDPDSDSGAENKDDLPWCIICNEDATVKCIGCDGDLYCKDCFEQGHEEWNLSDHKTVKYTPAT